MRRMSRIWLMQNMAQATLSAVMGEDMWCSAA
jgi:hypothetical protein